MVLTKSTRKKCQERSSQLEDLLVLQGTDEVNKKEVARTKLTTIENILFVLEYARGFFFTKGRFKRAAYVHANFSLASIRENTLNPSPLIAH